MELEDIWNFNSNDSFLIEETEPWGDQQIYLGVIKWAQVRAGCASCLVEHARLPVQCSLSYTTSRPQTSARGTEISKQRSNFIIP